MADELPPGIKGKRNLDEKTHLSYIDPHFIYEAGLGMRYGVNKHGFNNHRDMNADAAQYVLDALMRHLNTYLRGEQIDPESKVNHLACVLNNLNFLYRLDRLHGYDAVLRNVYGETK